MAMVNDGRRRGAAGEAERGVTLIETLAALMILSFVAISIVGLFSHGMMLNATGSDYTALVNAAKDKIEELMSLDYSHADLTPDAAHGETLSSPDVTITWDVAEHHIRQGAVDPGSAFGADPQTSTSAGNGNVKVILVTVISNAQFGLGNRNVSVQAIKGLD